MAEKSHVPDIDAIAPAEYVRRDDAAEKRNEVSGRQIPPLPDSVVEIQSAVHSNYANMIAMVGADNLVYLGRSERYDDSGYYNNSDDSLCFVTDNPNMYYYLYGEGWHYPQDEMLDRGLTLGQYNEFARLQDGVLSQFEQQRAILFAGQQFQAPENYLKSIEMATEANYNMIDGRLNNQPPARADLTDGQTHDEIMELAPETLRDDKPSVLDQLKADRPEHEARTVKTPEQERML